MVDVNMYSPHIGQSHSVERSMHLWEPSKEMDIHTPHFYYLLILFIPHNLFT